jgi:hypothetical protein
MTISSDLDDWADSIAQTVGLTVTRDPDLINPPCLYLDLPEVLSPTLARIGVEIPVFLVAGGSGKQAGDQLLDLLPDVLGALGAGTASPQTLTIGQVPFQTYKITVTATLQE